MITFETDIDRNGTHWWWEVTAYRDTQGFPVLVGAQSSRNLGVTFQRKRACLEHLEAFCSEWRDRLLSDALTLNDTLTQLIEIEYTMTRADEVSVVIPHPEYGYQTVGRISLRSLQFSNVGDGEWVEPDPTDHRLGRVEQVVVIEGGA